MTANPSGVQRLLWHAGLAERPGGAAGVSISEITSPATASSEGLAESLDDFVAALSELNRVLNGDVPSELTSGKAEDVPRAAAYATEEVVWMLRRAAEDAASPAEAESLLDAVWMIEVAWHAVLAGDVDDLWEHVAHARLAR